MSEPGKPTYRGERPGPDWVPPQTQGKDWVAIVLAIGMATGINFFIIGVWVNDAWHNRSLSAQSTQVLTTVFGGIVGVLGSYIGYKAGSASERSAEAHRAEGRELGRAQQRYEQDLATPPTPPPYGPPPEETAP